MGSVIAPTCDSMIWVVEMMNDAMYHFKMLVDSSWYWLIYMFSYDEKTRV